MNNARPLDLACWGRGLTRGVDGIWYAGAGAGDAVSYPAGGHDACLQVEDASFWFGHRNRCIVAAVAQYHPAERGAFFEVGAGNGFVARALASAGWSVVAIEPGLAGARNARERGLTDVVCASVEACGFANGSIPAIGAFDVVEHVPADVEFLAGLRGLLRPDGHLFLTVPAYSALWSAEDVAAGHYRRYNSAGLRALFAQAGLEPVYLGHIFRWLPLPIAVLRALPFRLGIQKRGAGVAAAKAQHGCGSTRLARWAAAMFASEVAAVERRREIDFGASLLAVARRSA